MADRQINVKRLFRPAEAAAYIGLGITTFRKIDMPRKRHGDCVLFEQSDLDAWADRLAYDGEGGTGRKNTCDEVCA